MILAEKITMLRKKNGWSQEELAMKLNISRQSVSKWESTASVPDLDKVIKLSQLFGVSTDYLLKDDMDMPESDGIADDTYEAAQVREVSLEEANSFLELSKKTAGRIALGVSACIIAPIPLIVLGGFADQKMVSENLAGGLGAIILLLLVGAAVAVFIWNGMQLDQYKYMEEEEVSLQYGIRGMVEKKKSDFLSTQRMCITIGVCLCILSVIPLFMTAALNLGDLPAVICVGVLLFLISGGVFCMVWSGCIMGSYDKMLQEGDYTAQKKAENKKNAPLAGIYWCLMTAIYLAWSFLSRRWDITWVIWPCAGVLFAALCGLMNMIRKRS